MAKEHLKKIGISYMEVSAKTSNNIKEFFKDLAYTIGGCKKEEKNSPSKPAAPVTQFSQPISLNNYQSQAEPEKKKCCWSSSI